MYTMLRKKILLQINKIYIIKSQNISKLFSIFKYNVFGKN